MNILTDIGVNLTHARFAKDLDEVINRALDAGVRRMIITGTDVQHSIEAIELCERYPRHLRCTVGCHPHDAKTMTSTHWQTLESLYSSPYVVAAGECGLDFDRNFSDPAVQVQVLIQQLELAAQYQLPVFLHERNAHRELITILHQYRTQLSNAVLHCFTGDEEQLKGYLELDMYIGITGWICDPKRNHELKEAIPLIPNDRLMIETDAPYLLPKTLTPKPKSNRNEPCHLNEVAKAVAEIKGLKHSIINSIATLNSAQFFNWPIDVHSVAGASE